MLFLDGVCVERPDGLLRFRWVKAPTNAEVTRLTHTLAHRTAPYLAWRGLLERNARHCYLSGEELEAGPMGRLLGSSITYSIAVGPVF
jgi:hypothetical protein